MAGGSTARVSMSTVGRRVAGGLRAAFVLAVATLLLAEVALQVAAWFAHDRETAWRPGASRHVLCVGDSHTFGAGVAQDEAYPGQLQRVLDERAPGVYSVVNKGVPGLSTTQVRSRLPALVGRLHPDLVIVWCGVNDDWNRLEDSSGSTWRERLEGIASRSRTYRLLLVTLHDRQLERDAEAARRADARPMLESENFHDPNQVQTIRWGDVVERVQQKKSPSRTPADMDAVLRADYEAMIAFARGAGLPIVFVTYPTELSLSARVNGALRDVTTRLGVSRVESGPSILRVPLPQRKFFWALHPNAPMYAEIARDVADVVIRLESSR